MISIENHQFNHCFVAPRSLLITYWENRNTQSLGETWQQVKERGFESVLFDSVAIGSPLFEDLNRQLSHAGLVANYVISQYDLAMSTEISELLKSGLHFTVTLTEPLSALALHRLSGIGHSFHQLRWVVLATKGKAFVEAYQTMPHHLSGQLYLNFPLSFSPWDCYFSEDEKQAVLSKVARSRPQHPVQSFLPEWPLLTHRGLNDLWFEGVLKKITWVEKVLGAGDRNELGTQSLFIDDPVNIVVGKSDGLLAALPWEQLFTGFHHFVHRLQVEILKPRLPKPYYWYLRWPVLKVYHFTRYQYYKRVLKKPLGLAGDH